VVETIFSIDLLLDPVSTNPYPYKQPLSNELKPSKILEKDPLIVLPFISYIYEYFLTNAFNLL
jgi:hypothetical protein